MIIPDIVIIKENARNTPSCKIFIRRDSIVLGIIMWEEVWCHCNIAWKIMISISPAIPIPIRIAEMADFALLSLSLFLYLLSLTLSHINQQTLNNIRFKVPVLDDSICLQIISYLDTIATTIRNKSSTLANTLSFQDINK